MPEPIANQLLQWYRHNQRQLPWRSSQDPYAIWIAEIMLQQTRVETVIPYYERWLEELPTLRSLAEADEIQVLKLWEGLGYYRRAHNLRAAARIVLDDYGGRLPSTRRELQSLPGIGAYTSAAIAAIAFDQDEIALDGNLRRVLVRFFDLDLDVHSATAAQKLEELGRSIMPPGSAADFNQALMDLGASICTPRSPTCASCPLQPGCMAHARGTQDARPSRQPDSARPLIHRRALAILRDKRVLLGRRPEGKLLGGLWEFPGQDLSKAALRELAPDEPTRGMLGLATGEPTLLQSYRHSYSHFRLHMFAYLARFKSGEPSSSVHTELRWVPLAELDSLPMGKVDRAFARDLQSHLGESGSSEVANDAPPAQSTG